MSIMVVATATTTSETRTGASRRKSRRQSTNGEYQVPKRIRRRSTLNGNYNSARVRQFWLYAFLIILITWFLAFLGVYEYYNRGGSGGGGGGSDGGGGGGVQPHISDDTRALTSHQLHPSHVARAGANFESPLLIFTCSRPEYLRETLDHIYDSLQDCSLVGCPIIISEDGQHESIETVVQTYQSKFAVKGIPVLHIHHQQDMKLQSLSSKQMKYLRYKDPGISYKALAQHYGWALQQVFQGNVFHQNDGSEQSNLMPQRVIILEEDIKVAPDFFSYMAATAPLLDSDPTLYAVSAFNDNGHLIKEDSETLLRSDFFPGLGWMMTAKLWREEFQGKWPAGFWDDWIRDPEQRKGRQVIRPEVSRTYHFGRQGGASLNQFGKILEMVKLNKHNVDWQAQDLSYLQNYQYEEQYLAMVNESRLASTVQEAQQLLQQRLGSSNVNVRLEYDDFEHFQALAKELRIMDDEKAMVPRTAYKGIVEVRPHGNNLLFLTPKSGQAFY